MNVVTHEVLVTRDTLFGVNSMDAEIKVVAEALVEQHAGDADALQGHLVGVVAVGGVEAEGDAHGVGDGVDAAVPAVSLARGLVADDLPVGLDEAVLEDALDPAEGQVGVVGVAARVERVHVGDGAVRGADDDERPVEVLADGEEDGVDVEEVVFVDVVAAEGTLCALRAALDELLPEEGVEC